MFKETKELWVKFACAALSGCARTVGERFEKIDSLEIDEQDIIDEDCDFAWKYADKMLALYRDKFENC